MENKIPSYLNQEILEDSLKESCLDKEVEHGESPEQLWGALKGVTNKLINGEQIIGSDRNPNTFTRQEFHDTFKFLEDLVYTGNATSGEIERYNKMLDILTKGR
ncbi:hypothetical protein COV24_02010 [candidate division WWE3 bacterium CG10_big_fil_rev_8_21_14_0_10_32_10]|uniref:Uncharacterized protein n=1 Tax=candidate division WWE3 bacterium CG10_big_fil_rev_8_21_14_0_10_32_10 TaxID=1975090 RepID=A0A2H0RAS1_UNCKA|nr:MAG: hypothetical protein COV24_02010 [candidate division WWE3 bacterium CG10_big_fil_rev_8_21_14_0_10_32_10]